MTRTQGVSGRSASAFFAVAGALLGLLATPAPRAFADAITLVSADERGVTLRLRVSDPTLVPQESGRSLLASQGLRVLDVPGRPRLPYAATLVALPPGARATVRVVSPGAEESRDVRLEPADKPTFLPDPSGEDAVPVREDVAAIVDAAWPASPVELGAPFTLRRQRLVSVAIRPFRYDEGSGRLWWRREMTVRVDFAGGDAAAGVPAPDRHWDAVLEQGVINHEQGTRWRMPRHEASRGRLSGASLFGAQPGALAGGPVFDDVNPEVRVKIDTTGVWAFDFDELAAKGYPAGIAIAKVSVHRHEFVESAVPSYATIELPIEVVDSDNNGIFGSGDWIVAWVQTWAERSRASVALRAWGDAEVVYVTALARDGLRLPTRNGWLNQTLTPLASYPYTQRWERNFSYYPFPDDTLQDQFHWMEIITYYSRPDTFEFETNHLDQLKPATFSATFQGRASSVHYTWAQIRRTTGGGYTSIADSVYWFGKDSLVATATFPGTTLGEGNVNHVRVWGKGSGAAPDPLNNSRDFASLDWFDATYWRRYRALNSYLTCNSGDATGDFQIRATNFDFDDVRIYDVTDSLAPVRLTLPAGHIPPNGFQFDVEFQDNAAAGRRSYVVFSSANAKLVPSDHITPVRLPRARLAENTAGDYLLVFPEAFRTAAEALRDLRASQGLRVVLAPLESVNDEFNGGRKSSYAIKRFVRHAFDNWDARFLLLLGDGSEDPQNLTGQSRPDFVPFQRINGPVFISFGYEIIPSDPWYVCLEGACDLNDLEPDLQSLFVGRLPVASPGEALTTVQKVIAYENFAADQTWRNKLLLVADDEYSTVSFFGGPGTTTPGYCRVAGERVFRLINEVITRVVADTAGLRRTEIENFNLGYYLRNERVILPGTIFGDTCRVDRAETETHTRGNVTPELLTRLNDGRMWFNFQGHANEGVLTHESLYLNAVPDDKDLLTNDGKPFLFSAFSCHANAFARVYDQERDRTSLGEEMVTLPLRGGIGSWASTGYEILPGFDADHINVEWARAMFSRPPHDEYLGDKGARVVLGETIAQALTRYVPTVMFDPNERGIALTYHLLGDPATRLSIGPPQSIVTANTLPVVDDQPVRLHTLGDTLRIEADLVSNVAITAISLDRTDATGTVTIPPSAYTITPAFPDTSSGGDGGRRYHLSYGTGLQADNYRYTIHTTDRYGVAAAFDVVFQFLTQLRLETNVLADGDVVPPAGNLNLQVFSPKPIDPQTDLTLTINGVPQAFTQQAVDASGREWVLSWTHAPYATGPYDVQLAVVGGGATRTHRFVVGDAELKIVQALAFPNPFEEDLGTHFSFSLNAAAPVDLQLRVYTISGRMVYERVDRGLLPAYHQIAWDGRDSEGAQLANGTYVYRLLATVDGKKAEYTGRLVKLRKPRRLDTP